MSSSLEPPSGPPPIRQKRSQRTYDALVETGLELLKDRDFDSLPVAEIAKAAGYSVGAFYARFNNKEELLRAMVERYAADRITGFEQLFAETSDAEIIDRYFTQQIARLWTHRFFWRAALYRSFQDPAFWEPFRGIVRRVGDRFVERAAQRVGRPLTHEEEMSIRFAIQVTNGAINNTLVNRPGPMSVDDAEFRPRLVRAFRKISGWDELGAGDQGDGSSPPSR